MSPDESNLIDLPGGDSAVRMGIFAALFVTFAALEAVYPRRKRTSSRPVRWYSNLGMTFLNSLSQRFIFPILGIEMALISAERGWGFFNDHETPYAVAFVASVVVLDLVVYLQHVVFHHVPWLWRLHRVHHADVDLDASSGIRFHVLESIISMCIKLGAIVAIGPPAMAALFFEILLNGAAMFNHANMRIPVGIDRVLRWLIVTPDMHRVHHSVIRDERNSNYGFNLPWWDRIFGTYRAQPAKGHEGMTIGLDRFRSTKEQHLHQLLIQPFRAGPGNRTPRDQDSTQSGTTASASKDSTS